jgi:hypothetical protein
MIDGRDVSASASLMARSIAARSVSPFADLQDLPPVGRVASADVLGGEGQCRRAVERDVVAVVEVDELSEFQMPGEGGGLT